ncbi:hypothetical protein [Nocardia pseudovaccinii]|uniref:hypothetical protein n=1 Tax=Nocardia pseudovaccinii TaxID=189540 RepID=UPI0012F509FF|nr:hypothetical protein [Nocardia pseudovaccinii]
MASPELRVVCGVRGVCALEVRSIFVPGGARHRVPGNLRVTGVLGNCASSALSVCVLEVCGISCPEVRVTGVPGELRVVCAVGLRLWAGASPASLKLRVVRASGCAIPVL